ncbi:MAG: hypothetical protein ACI4KA_08985 [Oscillospiraceae bacterium]
MKKSYYNVKLTECQKIQLYRYLSECAHKTIKEKQQIHEANKLEEIYDANTRNQIEALTARLKWFNNIMNALINAKIES